MTRHSDIQCSLCRRNVDAETGRRARHAFEPLIVCDRCLAEADARWQSVAVQPPSRPRASLVAA